MSQRDVREFGRVLAQLSMELRMVIMEAPRRHRSELRQVREIVERARFSLLTENDVRRAHRQVSRAKDAYRSVTRQFNLF